MIEQFFTDPAAAHRLRARACLLGSHLDRFAEFVSSLGDADLRLTEQALSHVTPMGIKPGRYQPDDELLAFLESL